MVSVPHFGKVIKIQAWCHPPLWHWFLTICWKITFDLLLSNDDSKASVHPISQCWPKPLFPQVRTQESLATQSISASMGPRVPLYCRCHKLGNVEIQMVSCGIPDPKWTFILTRELTRADGGRVVVSPEPAPCHTAIRDEDYRHEVLGWGEWSIEPITHPSNERRVVFRAIINQDVVIAAASFKPEDTEETSPFLCLECDVRAHISRTIVLITVTNYIIWKNRWLPGIQREFIYLPKPSKPGKILPFGAHRYVIHSTCPWKPLCQHRKVAWGHF